MATKEVFKESQMYLRCGRGVAVAGGEEKRREGRGIKGRMVEERKKRLWFTMCQMQEHGCHSHSR